MLHQLHSKPIIISNHRIDNMFSQLVLPESQLLAVDPRPFVNLANALICRGQIEIAEIRRNIIRMKMGLTFTKWNPDCWKTGICKVSPLGLVHCS